MTGIEQSEQFKEVSDLGKWSKQNPSTVHKPMGYSHVARVGDLIILAGQVGRDPSGRVPADVEDQARQVFENIKACLAAEGVGLKDLAKVTIYITDYKFKDAVLKVRDHYLSESPPTSMFVVCSALALPEYLVEVEGIAVAP